MHGAKDMAAWSRFDGFTGEQILTTAERHARYFAQIVTDRTWQQHHNTCPAHVRAWHVKTPDGMAHYAAQCARWEARREENRRNLLEELDEIGKQFV